MEINDLTNKIKNIINEDTLWEMSNLRKNRTGLPCNISIQFSANDKRKYKHNIPRLKFQNNTSDTVTSIKDLIPISIEDEPRVLIDVEYNTKLFKAVYNWIILNKNLLLQYWNQDIDDFDFIQQMRKI